MFLIDNKQFSDFFLEFCKSLKTEILQIRSEQYSWGSALDRVRWWAFSSTFHHLNILTIMRSVKEVHLYCLGQYRLNNDKMYQKKYRIGMNFLLIHGAKCSLLLTVC